MKTRTLITALMLTALVGVAADEKAPSAPSAPPPPPKPAGEQKVGGPGGAPLVGRSFRSFPRVTLNLQLVPFATAAKLLCESVGRTAFVSAELPPYLVNLSVKDEPFPSALARLIDAVGGPSRVSVNVAGDRVEFRPSSGRAAEPSLTRLIRLRYVSAEEVANQVLPRVLQGLMVAALPRDNSVVLRGPQSLLKDAEQLIAALDSPGNELQVSCMVRGHWNGKPVEFAPQIITLAGREASVEEGSTSAGGPRFNVRVTAVPVENGLYALTHTWHVSLPIQGTGQGSRVEKRMSATVHVRAGEAVEVGQLNGAQYDVNGRLTFVIAADRVRNPNRK